MAAPAARAPTTTTSWREVGSLMLVSSSQQGAGSGCGSVGDVAGDEGGVVADAVDEVRVAAVLEALAEHVQPGDRGDAAPVDDLALRVEDRHLQPRVAAAVAGGPHDGADAGGTGVEPGDRLGRAQPVERGRPGGPRRRGRWR